MNNLISNLHAAFIYQHRADVLTKSIYSLIDASGFKTGLDVGCGKGDMIQVIHQLNPKITLTGIDIVQRKDAVANIMVFDGKTIPLKSKSVDFAILVDVLHHTDDPGVLVRECARVAREFIVIKDHFCNGAWDKRRLSFMDWGGNQGYQARLPYNFLSESQWQALFEQSGLVKEKELRDLKLYRWPMNLIFENGLHFIAKLKIQ